MSIQIRYSSARGTVASMIVLLLFCATIAAAAITPLDHQRSGRFSAGDAASNVPPQPKVLVEPWGANALRVRISAPGANFNDNVPSALRFNPAVNSSEVFTDGRSIFQNGDIHAVVDIDTSLLSFFRVSDGKLLLKEIQRDPPNITVGSSAPARGAVAFAADPSDQVYGHGQGVPLIPYPTTRVGPLNRKGAFIDFELCQANEGGMANCLPWHFVVRNQSVEYGFLWNVPSFGGVSLASNYTAWWADYAWQLDYVVMVPPPSAEGAARFSTLHAQYTAIVGRTKPLPSSLLGYWHSKNAYRTQDEVLTAMAGFRNRSIPVDVFVIDIGGSQGKLQGDWAFNPDQFPDPSNMTATLAETNTRVMVSVWAGTQVNSTSWESLVRNRWVAKFAGKSSYTPIPWPIGCDGPECYMYDASNSDARAYVWSRVQAGYVKHNISLFWLDASEPQPPNPGVIPNTDYDEGAFSNGTMSSVGAAWTQWHTTTFAEGFAKSGLTESVMLARSGWFGTSFNGAALWSGDTLSDWSTLKASITTGLGAQITGIAWWTTDVGGYRLWNTSAMPPAELVVRWFQFGLTCPLLRQHGHRPETVPWAYGPQAEKILTAIIRQRVAMKPYLRKMHDLLSVSGLPINRPLWWDFPHDDVTWTPAVQETQYMFGTEYLAAPITEDGARSRMVYLPTAQGEITSVWRHYYSNQSYPGGAWYNISAPLDEFPLFHLENNHNDILLVR